MRGRWLLGLALAGALASPGCATIRIEPTVADAPTPPAEPTTPWRVGAAQVDITPPPGYATGGHSTESALARGVWTRLQAQAIYVEDRSGTPLVLAVADLWAVEAGLVDAIAQRLRQHPGLRHVGREHLIVAATHTHHGPVGFSTAKIYSAFAGSQAGHDPALFDMLTTRLTAAIAQAAASRRPAQIIPHTVAVGGLARNRSVAALLEDPEAPELLRANASLPGCPEFATTQGVDPCHAVDPRLDAIEFRDPESGRPIAIAGVFAMHPTAMPRATELFHADVFGLARTHARNALRASDGTTPIVAMFNGPEGDVSPNWAPQGRDATEWLGQALGETLVAALDEPSAAVDGSIELAFGWRTLAGQRWTDGSGTEQKTARYPRSGRSQFAGAEDGRTRLHGRGWHEGQRRRRPRRNGHGHKRLVAPWPLGAFAPPPGMTSRSVPLTVASLGPLVLVTLPGEVTTILGNRIATAVAATRPRASNVITLGLAGGYLSYFTTPQEYTAQHYEGGSMLWGEQAGALLSRHLVELAASGAVESSGPEVFRAGRRHHQDPTRALQKATGSIEQRLPVQLDAESLANVPHVLLWDDPPRWPSPTPTSRTTVRATIERFDEHTGWQPLGAASSPVDDQSGDLVTAVTHAEADRWRWGVWWLKPRADIGQPLRFRVDTAAGPPRCSEPFTIKRWLSPHRSRRLAMKADCPPGHESPRR